MTVHILYESRVGHRYKRSLYDVAWVSNVSTTHEYNDYLLYIPEGEPVTIDNREALKIGGKLITMEVTK